MLRLLSTCLFIALIGTSSIPHKYYVSITDLEYDEGSSTLQVSMKYFIDDLEIALEKEVNQKLHLGTEREKEVTNIILRKYLSEHFQLEQAEQRLKFEYIGKQVETEYIWIFLEYADYQVDQPAKLTHSVLTEYFQEQNNKVNFYNGNKSKSFTLHKEKVSEEF